MQEGTYERVGEEQTRSADVRVVAATNRDLQGEVKAGRFREDLFYRLSVFPIHVVPLRDRKEDIPELADHFLVQSCRKIGVETPKLKKRHVAELERYGWPGNVRELQNVVERAVIRSRFGPLDFHLPGSDRGVVPPGPDPPTPSTAEPMTDREFRRLERQNILAVLERANWKISGRGGAADFLGVHPATLSSRMRAMGIERPK